MYAGHLFSIIVLSVSVCVFLIKRYTKNITSIPTLHKLKYSCVITNALFSDL